MIATLFSRKRSGEQNSAYSLPAEDSCRRTLLPAEPDLSDRISLKGCFVRIILSGSSTTFRRGKAVNISTFRNDVEVFTLDIADGSGLAEAFRGADYVIHEAAIPSVPNPCSIRQFKSRQNVDGTLSVLVAARDAG